MKLMGVGALAVTSLSSFTSSKSPQTRKGNIRHSASRWCYSDISLSELCEFTRSIGMEGIDLLKPSEWKTVIDGGLRCTMVNPEEFSLEEGFNDQRLHKSLQKTYKELIDKASLMKISNVVCFSGNRRKGISEEDGIAICSEGLAPLVKYAEEKGITLMMELLNSKIDHVGYQCDRTEWGVQLCKKLGSENFKLLYDIYHMQIMEGDIIATIRKYHSYFGHYHTGGVPGRNEVNETQELFYPAIMQAIVDTGFSGFVAQEFVPTRENVLDSLKEAIDICDV